MRKRMIVTFVAALILAALPITAAAQRTTASVRGTVTDSSKALVPGATVTITNQDTGFARTTVSDSDGVFTVTELPNGRYTIVVTLQGFKTATRTEVVLNVADDRKIDFELAPGAVTEDVRVQADATPVKTSGGDVSGVINGQLVRELPLNGRNFLQLATLMPGVSAPDFLNVKDKGLLGGSDLSVSGGGVTSNLWTVDGSNNNDVGSNRTILVYPSVDAIEEFKILRNSYGAEFGQSGGAQINIVTRSGTNKFSGSGFYSGRNDALNATNYFLDQANKANPNLPKQKDQLSRNDFGYTIGGPIVKNKAQFFFSEEWNRETRGNVRAAFVPTAAERAGDFSGPSIANCSQPTPIDPLTGQAFPGNRIPANRLSPGGQAFLQLYALPNSTPAAGTCNNWVTSLNTPINWRQENGRVDYSITNASRLMVRYTQDAWNNNSPNLNGNLWGDDPFPAVDSNWDQPGRSLVASLNQTLGSKAVNTLQFSYSANKITVTRGGTDAALNGQILQLIPFVQGSANHEYAGDEGHPVFWGGAYQSLWNEAPFHNNQDLYVLKDDYSLVFGKHLIKAGGLWSSNQKNEDVGGFGSFENSAFWGSSGLNGGGGTTGNILADFLLKDMLWGFSENSGQRQVPQRWNDLEFYVSDSWKPNARMTVDYGVRYSAFYNPYAADNQLMSFDPASFNPALGGDPCNGLLQPPGTTWCQDAGAKGGASGPNRSLFPQDLNNFAPRLGFAWDVKGDGKTAIRAGLGQFYLRERLSPGLNIGNNPPFNNVVSGTRVLDSAAEPCAGCFGRSIGTPNSGRAQESKTPNNWQWNLSYQREIFPRTTLDVGYVGNKGYDLLTIRDANPVLSGDANHNGVDDRLEFARSNPADGSLRQFGSAFGNKTIGLWEHTGHSSYHSLQTQVLTRFWGASQAQASYTLSRTKANNPLDNSSGSISQDEARYDVTNPASDEGLANTDRMHIFNAAMVLALPTMADEHGMKAAFLGGWEISTIFQAASGQAVTVYTGSLGNGLGEPSGTGYGNSRPNMAVDGDCRADNPTNKSQILDPAAFQMVGFQLGTIGNEKRGQCRGPGFSQTDLAFYKTIRAGSKLQVQARFEIFNVFNTTNFLSQGLNTTFGSSSYTLNPAQTAIASYTPNGSFGQATRTRDARQTQFGFKVIF